MSEPTVHYRVGAGRGSWLDWLVRRRRARWHTYTAQVGPDGTYEWVDGELTSPVMPQLWGVQHYDANGSPSRVDLRDDEADAREGLPCAHRFGGLCHVVVSLDDGETWERSASSDEG